MVLHGSEQRKFLQRQFISITIHATPTREVTTGTPEPWGQGGQLPPCLFGKCVKRAAVLFL